MVKNTTRISSLLGTWTGQTRMKALVGPYSMEAYFIVHLMPDPLRGYGCQQAKCSELENHVCVEHDDRNTFSTKCVDLKDGEIAWSDVSAFFFFGARVDAGVPFNRHVDQNTGGWIGPLSMILAQNSTADALDQYVVRYVQTPTTPYLHMHPNCTLFDPEDFERSMGTIAVNETIQRQTHASHGEDPYEPYLKTCDNGDVKPILPLFDFIFVNDTDGSEKLEIKLDYKILTFPKKDKPMYKLFPMFQEKMNKRKGSTFHISGPYCYEDDPKRGWTFDLNWDSKDANGYTTVVHGCVEGLPCLPLAAEISVGGPATDMIHVDPKTGTFGSEVLLTIVVYALSMALLISMTYNCRHSQRATREQRRQRPPESSPRPRVPPGPYGDFGDGGALNHPLLEHEDAASETKEDDTDEPTETANVQFV